MNAKVITPMEGVGMEKVGRGSGVPAHRETRILCSTVPRT